MVFTVILFMFTANPMPSYMKQTNSSFVKTTPRNRASTMSTMDLTTAGRIFSPSRNHTPSSARVFSQRSQPATPATPSKSGNKIVIFSSIYLYHFQDFDIEMYSLMKIVIFHFLNFCIGDDGVCLLQKKTKNLSRIPACHLICRAHPPQQQRKAKLLAANLS